MKKLKALGVLFASLVLTMMFTCLVSAAAPTGLKQTNSATTSVTVSWDSVLSASSYQVLIYDSADNKNVSTAYSASKTFYDLSPGKTYYVKVAYEGVWSDPIEVVTRTGKVSSSTFKQTNATTTTATLSWDAVAGATGYDVYVSPDNSTSNLVYVKTVTTNSATINLNTTKVCAAVRAFRKSSAGYKAVNAYNDATLYSVKLVPGKLSKPSGYEGGYWPSGKNLYVKSNYDSSTQDGWQVQYCKYNGKGKKTVAGGYSQTCSISVKTNMFYKVRARAYVTINGTNKYGAWSAYNIIAQDQTYGSEYKNTSSASKLKFKITWNKVKGAKNYTIYMSTNQKTGYKKVATTKKRYLNVSKFKKKSLKKGQKYYYYIIANRKVGKKTYKSGKEYTRYIYFY